MSLKVNVNSWHCKVWAKCYSLYNNGYVPSERNAPKSLCTYFWLTVLSFIGIPVYYLFFVVLWGFGMRNVKVYEDEDSTLMDYKFSSRTSFYITSTLSAITLYVGIPMLVVYLGWGWGYESVLVLITFMLGGSGLSIAYCIIKEQYDKRNYDADNPSFWHIVKEVFKACKSKVCPMIEYTGGK